MATVEFSSQTGLIYPPEAVHAILSEPSLFPDWCPEKYNPEYNGGVSPGDFRFRITPLSITGQVKSAQPVKKIHWEFGEGDFEGSIEWRLNSADSGTELSCVGTGVIHGVLNNIINTIFPYSSRFHRMFCDLFFGLKTELSRLKDVSRD
ncbi:MAG: hypothetical protein K9N46_08335 [Candidatus Marinimicrobia bacterium]|nr:hypothetical protein [Candidatus Neomarinimicrobiota bacterium]MCF7828815.1 hypothetical protein [Candidatus Neomarinimicrobiota bacterium]MCF7880732.1 hypothetical protein [Candidatus Neomarinimicrobiota bacterium]